MESLETLTLIFLGLDLGWNKGRLECTKNRMENEGKTKMRLWGVGTWSVFFSVWQPIPKAMPGMWSVCEKD